jgi:hypothetical protein
MRVRDDPANCEKQIRQMVREHANSHYSQKLPSQNTRRQTLLVLQTPLFSGSFQCLDT